jgi:hypothetical protein
MHSGTGDRFVPQCVEGYGYRAGKSETPAQMRISAVRRIICKPRAILIRTMKTDAIPFSRVKMEKYKFNLRFTFPVTALIANCPPDWLGGRVTSVQQYAAEGEVSDPEVLNG